jgi:NAD(P)-dependent dehydrogenase (short-subunit alcohol dehydrogenase family)
MTQSNELYHNGMKGMKWGKRRFQNKDGSLTPAGKKRYDDSNESDGSKKKSKYRTKLEERYMSKGLSREQAEKAAASKIKTQKVLAVIGAVTVAAAATYLVHKHVKERTDQMIEKGSGVILNTSSMVSIYGQPSGVSYPTSKFAVNGLTVSLARELGPKGIRVNAVAPGITETDMMKAVPKEVIDPMIAQIPLRRLGQPEDIANAFLFLASDEASYIKGVVLSVDGMARS